jgi:predicted GNAT family acetyltransferase
VSPPAEKAIVDDAAGHRFVLRADGAEAEAELVYRTVGPRLVLVHTGVPDDLSGRGIGSRLVRAAVERAERTGETIVPLCPYARKWLQDHPDDLSGVRIDWKDPSPS